MRDIIINEILIPSLQKLYKVDYDNIKFDVSERNICARLAHHIENRMRADFLSFMSLDPTCYFNGAQNSSRLRAGL